MRRFVLYPLVLALVLAFTLPAQSSPYQEKTYVVALKIANIRALPSTEGKIIYTLSPGEKAEFLQEDGEWIKIRLADGRTGYVWRQLVRIETVKIKNASPPSSSIPPQPQPISTSSAKKARFGFSFNFQYALVNPQDFNANVGFINGIFQYYSVYYPSANIDHPLEELKRLMGGGVEFKYYINENLSINTGLSYFYAKKTTDSTFSVSLSSGTGKVTYSLELEPKIAAPYFGLSFNIPTQNLDLEIFGNLGYFMGNFHQRIDFKSEISSTVLDTYWEKFEIKKSTLGFMVGSNLRLKFNEKMGILVGGKYTLANFKDLEGDYSNSGGSSLHGNVYTVKISLPGVGPTSLMTIDTSPPSGSGILEAKKAEFKFSGFYFNVGLFFRF